MRRCPDHVAFLWIPSDEIHEGRAIVVAPNAGRLSHEKRGFRDCKPASHPST